MRMIACLLVLGLAACAPVGAPRVGSASVEVWVTLPDQSALLAPQAPLSFGAAMQRVRINSIHRSALIRGRLRRSITDASAYLSAKASGRARRAARRPFVASHNLSLPHHYRRSDFREPRYILTNGKADRSELAVLHAPAKSTAAPSGRTRPNPNSRDGRVAVDAGWMKSTIADPGDMRGSLAVRRHCAARCRILTEVGPSNIAASRTARFRAHNYLACVSVPSTGTDRGDHAVPIRAPAQIRSSNGITIGKARTPLGVLADPAGPVQRPAGIATMARSRRNPGCAKNTPTRTSISPNARAANGRRHGRTAGPGRCVTS